MHSTRWNVEEFISSSPSVALEYQHWLNRRIYKSSTKIVNPLWTRAWDEFFESHHAIDFQVFLGTPTGKKWLSSKLGEHYQAWQNG